MHGHGNLCDYEVQFPQTVTLQGNVMTEVSGLMVEEFIKESFSDQDSEMPEIAYRLFRNATIPQD